MPKVSNYLKLHKDVLLEYIFDSDNIKNDEYQVLVNLLSSNRTYINKNNINNINNTYFSVDENQRKYVGVDINKYNYLKLENYSSNFSVFDKLKIYFPSNYSFLDNNYIGFFIRVYCLDRHKNVIELLSYLYDDTDVNSYKYINIDKEIYYNQQSWSKYIKLEIPSLNNLKQMVDVNNKPIENSLNYNLTKGIGVDFNSPIFIEFSFVINKENILNNIYYYLSYSYKKTISSFPEYADLYVKIQESTNGDYFEIYGKYGDEDLDTFVEKLIYNGKKIYIEYEVNLYEENILTQQQTFIVKENFSKPILFRPIFTYTNTTASIDVTMRIINMVDNSVVDRFASISLTNEIFKYGRHLTRINVSDINTFKIYNIKQNQNNTNLNNNQIYNINITKVNFPVIADRVKILVNSSSSLSTEYKGMGLAEIVINPFDSIFKINIATTDANDNIIPFDLTKLLNNSKITLSFKSDNDFLEKDIWYESDQNNYELGTIVFKIDQADVPILKKIYTQNRKFYLTIVSEKTGIRTLLYSGRWIFFEDVRFVDVIKSNVTETQLGLFVDNSINQKELNDTLQSVQTKPLISSNNYNLIVFLKADANVINFEEYLKSISANVYLKRPTGNSNVLIYFYFILNLTQIIIDDIKKRDEVMEAIPLPICVGIDAKTDDYKNNLDKIRDSILNFNCVNLSSSQNIENNTNNSDN